MYAYYSAASPPPASTLMYASAPGAANARAAYKSLLPAIEAIAARCNKSHFFTLLNFSPRAAPTIVSRASDLDDIAARYAGVIMPVAAPPSGAPWRAMNVLKLDCIFSNNYGRHAHTFSARPTGFLWDWQCMGAHVLGVGCLTLQDTFFLWARGTPAAMEIATEVLDAPFGAPIAVSTQATHFVEADEPTKE
jgi:hypothetical protein